jgi:hypothetical protein
MHASQFGSDLLIYLSVFCDDLADIVRFWIAFSSLRVHVPEYDRAWKQILKFWAMQNQNQHNLGGLDDIIMRLGCRLDSGGLLLLERVCSPRKCSRSGCFRLYKEKDNSNRACCFHPGKMTRGSLTCCKKSSFREEGCARTWHDGALYESIYSRRERLEEDEDSENEDVYYTGTSSSSSETGAALRMKSCEFINRQGGIYSTTTTIDAAKKGSHRRRRKSSGALSALLALQESVSAGYDE